MAVAMFLVATMALNRARRAKGLWPDLGAWSLIVLAVAWPLNVVLAVILVAGVALAVFLIRTQAAAAEEEPPSLAAVIVLAGLGTVAMGMHYWFETGPTSQSPGATTTQPDELESGGEYDAEPQADDEF